ncbi:MAG: AmmeMemoRadiSam system protein B, partial [Phycisphaerales bacterium]
MTTPQQPSGQPSGEAPKFDPNAPHQQKPRLRPVRGFPVQHQGQTAMGLADAQQISQKVVFTMPAAQVILPHMTGEKTLDDIVSTIGQGLTRQMLEQFVAQLDDAGLIEGPKFDKILAEVRAEYDSLGHLPPAMTAVVADMLVKQKAQEAGATVEPSREEMDEKGPDLLREQLDAWMNETLKEAEEPSFDALPRAVVTPHIDYFRGWPNYAHIYGRMRVVDRPDRVIILGTNHFGRATGVTGCDKGFETPLGLSPLDEEFVALLKRNLGDENTERLFEHRFDHEREHSIECQVPWLQHVFGNDGGEFPKVFGVMVHDPTHTGGESYDGAGLGLQPFVEALRGAIESSPGRTLVVCSADLSHVGAQFGDQIQLTAETDE